MVKWFCFILLLSLLEQILDKLKISFHTYIALYIRCILVWSYYQLKIKNYIPLKYLNFTGSSIERVIMIIYLIKFDKSSLCSLAYDCKYCEKALRSKALENKFF